MWHIHRHTAQSNKYFDIAFIKRGKYIVGSNQGYRKHSQCIKTLRMIDVGVYQDDTKVKPVIVVIENGKPVTIDKSKTSKPYKP